MLTTVSLGRPPGFGELPDNVAAHNAVYVLAIPAALLTIAGPFLIPIGLVWGLAQPFGLRAPKEMPTAKRIVCLTTYVVILTIVDAVYSSDPYGAIYWFWD
ncbi:hypothetical protein [Planctomycetes bacterium CA13]